MKKKIFSIILIITIAILAMSTVVSALSFTATMSTNSTTVPEATEFTVRIRVSNLDVGTNGINSLKGDLKYDTDVFEPISEASVEGLNKWSASYDSTTGKIELTKNMFVSSTQEVLSITFKTKSGVTGKKGSIAFNNITASNSETDISATDISTSITVGTPDATSNTTNTSNTSNTLAIPTITSNTSVENSTNNTSNRTTNNTNTANKVNTTNTNTSNVSSYVNTMTNTTSNENMPKTGVSDTLLILTVVAIAVAFGFYVKIEKLNKDM